MSDHPPARQYPGLGMDLRHYDESDAAEIYPIGIHESCYRSDSEMLLIREVAMMIVMDQLTDKVDWHIKVFDDAIAEKWIEEALALPVGPLYDDIVQLEWNKPKRLRSILNRKCLEYCIKELRSKAEFYKKTCLIPTLDASASIVKSDTFIEDSLRASLQTVFSKLKQDQKDDPDWHPRSNDMVQNLVHPSLYPLVYGRSRVFPNEVVGVEDAIDRWSGKGEVIPKNLKPTPGLYSTNMHGIPDSYWSDNYQWLPSNVSFQDDGSVKFTSYINGLHPVKHRDTYKTIEKFIEKALPAWDFCLPRYHSRKMVGACRTKPRFEVEDPDDENEANWSLSLDQVPLRDGKDEADSEGSGSEFDPEERQQEEWQELREPIQPEAPEFKAWDYGIKPGESLREHFQDIQVIVKMASIELTPEKPTFPAGGWHVEGQMNEHIVGTALYYLDSENVTSSYLKFRMQTSSYQDDLQDKLGQDSYSWVEQVYGAGMSGGECLQQYGSVETKEGRLLAFPNVFHHRVSPFELQDKTKPGHRRFIALWLVDPLTRIINTGNVPPQQHSWWVERAFGNLSKEEAEKISHPIAQIVSEAAPEHDGLRAAAKSGKPLPEELMDMVRREAADSTMPMTLEEAKAHRLKLMDERGRLQEEAEGNWRQVTYHFCEH